MKKITTKFMKTKRNWSNSSCNFFTVIKESISVKRSSSQVKYRKQQEQKFQSPNYKQLDRRLEKQIGNKIKSLYSQETTSDKYEEEENNFSLKIKRMGRLPSRHYRKKKKDN